MLGRNIQSYVSLILILRVPESITILTRVRCSDMELIREVRLLIILICLGMVVMVSESLACNLQKLNFKLEGEGENNSDIKIENGLFGSLPRGTGASSGPSQCRNYRSSNGSGGGPCSDSQVNAEGINAYPGLSCIGWNCSTIHPAKQNSSAMVA